jgi:hypothetical protein
MRSDDWGTFCDEEMFGFVLCQGGESRVWWVRGAGRMCTSGKWKRERRGMTEAHGIRDDREREGDCPGEVSRLGGFGRGKEYVSGRE